MKKYLLLIIPCLIVYAVITYWPRPKEPQVLGEIEKPLPQITSAWLKVSGAEKIKLYPNYQDKLTTAEAKAKYNCEAIVSGGFYSSESKPLGLVISDRQKLANYRKNALFNGLYSINDLETSRITRDVPKDSLRLALQSGPLLLENGILQELKLIRDEQARRVVVATTGDNQTLFIVFYNPNSLFLGPSLTDLPNELEIFQKQNNLFLADALNLDGGTASAFNSADINLTEASTVGSFFCILPR